MRKSDIFFIFLGACMALGLAALTHSHAVAESAEKSISFQAEMVRDLELTDLCLFTEARYTRHPTQADRHTPFQDHPMSLEHFPTGSIISPPAVVTEDD